VYYLDQADSLLRALEKLVDEARVLDHAIMQRTVDNDLGPDPTPEEIATDDCGVGPAPEKRAPVEPAAELTELEQERSQEDAAQRAERLRAGVS